MTQLGIADAERTPQGRCVLYVIATGERVESWPVDGKDMLEQGDWTVENPNAPAGGVVEAVAEAPASPVEDPVPHDKPVGEHPLGMPLDTTGEGLSAGPVKPLDEPVVVEEEKVVEEPQEPSGPVVDPTVADAEAAVAAAEAAVLAATTEGARKKLRKELATLRRRLTITRKRVEAAKE